jgi:hypothetical protein
MDAVANLRLPLSAVLVALACGAPPAVDEEEEVIAEVSGNEVPASDRDPLPFTPPPTGTGSTDETVALVAAGGEDQARHMLPTFLRAVRDADERGLDTLFGDEVAQVRGRGDTPPRPRAALVERILIYAQRSIFPADTALDELVDFSSVHVTRAAQFWHGREMPDGLQPTDVVVEVALLEPGRGPLRAMLGWDLRGHLVVRPGRDPRIVGL